MKDRHTSNAYERTARHRGPRLAVTRLPDESRRHFSLTMYPGATFGWDSRFSSDAYSSGAHKQKGGIVHITADAALAERSRQFAVSYFTKNLEEK